MAYRVRIDPIALREIDKFEVEDVHRLSDLHLGLADTCERLRGNCRSTDGEWSARSEAAARQ
jgi:hypothetical protein